MKSRDFIKENTEDEHTPSDENDSDNVDAEKKPTGTGTRSADSLEPTDWKEILSRLSKDEYSSYKKDLEDQKRGIYLVGLKKHGSNMFTNSIRKVDMTEYIKTHRIYPDDIKIKRGYFDKNDQMIISILKENNVIDDNYDLGEDLLNGFPIFKKIILPRISIIDVPDTVDIRFDDNADDPELLTFNTLPTEQDIVKARTQAYYDAYVGSDDQDESLIKAGLKTFRSQIWTIKGIKKIFHGYSQGEKKYSQKMLLEKIVDKFTETPNRAADLFPITIIDDIQRLNDKYKIQGANSIGVSFGEILGPIGLLTNNINGNGARMLPLFFGKENVNQLNDSNRPATIHFNKTKNSSLYDSFIEFEGRVVGVSSKVPPTAGASISGLRKAINEIKNNPEALRRFRQEFPPNSPQSKMFANIVKMIEGDVEEEKIENAQTTSRQKSKMDIILDFLQDIHSSSYSDAQKQQDKDRIGAILSRGTTIKKLNNKSIPVGKWLSGFSDFLYSRIDVEKISDKETKTPWYVFQQQILKDITKSFNNDPLFSQVCTWILNHSGIIQIDLYHNYSDLKKYAENVKNIDPTINDNRVPYQIINIVATWPSTLHDKVTLKDSSSLKFVIDVNVLDGTPENQILRDQDFPGDTNNKFSKRENVDKIKTSDDWALEKQLTSKLTLDKTEPNADEQYLGIKKSTIYPIALKYIPDLSTIKTSDDVIKLQEKITQDYKSQEIGKSVIDTLGDILKSAALGENVVYPALAFSVDSKNDFMEKLADVGINSQAQYESLRELFGKGGTAGKNIKYLKNQLKKVGLYDYVDLMDTIDDLTGSDNRKRSISNDVVEELYVNKILKKLSISSADINNISKLYINVPESLAKNVDKFAALFWACWFALKKDTLSARGLYQALNLLHINNFRDKKEEEKLTSIKNNIQTKILQYFDPEKHRKITKTTPIDDSPFTIDDNDAYTKSTTHLDAIKKILAKYKINSYSYLIASISNGRLSKNPDFSADVDDLMNLLTVEQQNWIKNLPPHNVQLAEEQAKKRGKKPLSTIEEQNFIIYIACLYWYRQFVSSLENQQIATDIKANIGRKFIQAYSMIPKDTNPTARTNMFKWIAGNIRKLENSSVASSPIDTAFNDQESDDDSFDDESSSEIAIPTNLTDDRTTKLLKFIYDTLNLRADQDSVIKKIFDELKNQNNSDRNRNSATREKWQAIRDEIQNTIPDVGNYRQITEVRQKTTYTIDQQKLIVILAWYVGQTILARTPDLKSSFRNQATALISQIESMKQSAAGTRNQTIDKSIVDKVKEYLRTFSIEGGLTVEDISSLLAQDDINTAQGFIYDILRKISQTEKLFQTANGKYFIAQSQKTDGQNRIANFHIKNIIYKILQNTESGLTQKQIDDYFKQYYHPEAEIYLPSVFYAIARQSGKLFVKKVGKDLLFKISDNVPTGGWISYKDYLSQSSDNSGTIAESISQSLKQVRENSAKAAGCLVMAADTGRVCLGHRSRSTDYPSVWATFGGHCKQGENTQLAALRELGEEAGGSIHEILDITPLDHRNTGTLDYTTYLVTVPREFTPRLNSEHDDSGWYHLEALPGNLHPGLAQTLKRRNGILVRHRMRCRSKHQR